MTERKFFCYWVGAPYSFQPPYVHQRSSRLEQTTWLRELSINLTAHCNLDCIYCETHQLDISKEINAQRLLTIVQEIVSQGIQKVNIYGGEPFLRPIIWNILSYLGAVDVDIVVGTNGVFASQLDREQLELLDATVSKLCVSLDSADPKIEDQISGREGAFVLKTKGLKKLAQLNRTHLAVTTVISRLNYEKLARLIPFCKDLGVSSIHFQPIGVAPNYPGTRAKANKMRLLIEDHKGLYALKEQLSICREVADGLGISTNVSQIEKWIFTYFTSIRSDQPWFMRLKADFTCITPSISSFIMHDGSLHPCALLPRVANIRDSQLAFELEKTRWAAKRVSEGQFFDECKLCFCQIEPSLQYHSLI